MVTRCMDGMSTGGSLIVIASHGEQKRNEMRNELDGQDGSTVSLVGKRESTGIAAPQPHRRACENQMINARLPAALSACPHSLFCLFSLSSVPLPFSPLT